ncbi:MAG: hypothetical protein LBF51_00635 [Zoogloeaceae bacterium]|nr:hypothetical protein [Zoogloeaceae bacterium]
MTPLPPDSFHSHNPRYYKTVFAGRLLPAKYHQEGSRAHVIGHRHGSITSSGA